MTVQRLKHRPVEVIRFLEDGKVGRLNGHAVIKLEKGDTKVCLIDDVIEITTISSKLQIDAFKYWNVKKTKYLVGAVILFISVVGIPFAIFCLKAKGKAKAKKNEWLRDIPGECSKARIASQTLSFQEISQRNYIGRFITPEESFNKFLDDVSTANNNISQISSQRLQTFFTAHPLRDIDTAIDLISDEHDTQDLIEVGKRYQLLQNEFVSFSRDRQDELKPIRQKLSQLEHNIQRELQPYREKKLADIASARKLATQQCNTLERNRPLFLDSFDDYFLVDSHIQTQKDLALNACQHEIRIAEGTYEFEERRIRQNHQQEKNQIERELRSAERENEESVLEHFQPKIEIFLQSFPELTQFYFPSIDQLESL